MTSYLKSSNNSNKPFRLFSDNLSSLKILLAYILGICDFEEIYSMYIKKLRCIPCHINETNTETDLLLNYYEKLYNEKLEKIKNILYNTKNKIISGLLTKIFFYLDKDEGRLYSNEISWLFYLYDRIIEKYGNDSKYSRHINNICSFFNFLIEYEYNENIYIQFTSSQKYYAKPHLSEIESDLSDDNTLSEPIKSIYSNMSINDDNCFDENFANNVFN